MKLHPVTARDTIDRETFQSQYLRNRQPLVLKRQASDWPALSRWTADFWSREHGDKQVPVYDASFVRPGAKYMSHVEQMALRDYVHEIQHSQRDLRMFLYNIMAKAPELYADVRLPDLADGFSKRFVFMFFGCAGSVTPIHIDIDMSHVFHVQVYGRKRCLLFSPEQNTNLYRHPFTVRSYVDPANPDYQRYPRLQQAEGYEVVLEAGDMLFIPSGWWHHMIYEQGGWAISLRCKPERLSTKLQGLYNLLVLNVLDRVANWVAPKGWYAWKERQSQRA
ncbi:MAG: hypothetical protein Tsb002_05340 [Wenzhouxiangellaceae bacterium]